MKPTYNFHSRNAKLKKILTIDDPMKQNKMLREFIQEEPKGSVLAGMAHNAQRELFNCFSDESLGAGAGACGEPDEASARPSSFRRK